MMSMQSSTHSSQMNTVGPAISFFTSCCDLPQNEQYSVFLLSPPEVVLFIDTSKRPSASAPTGATHQAQALESLYFNRFR